MSIGNLKDSGNQGNNFPWQYKVLKGLQSINDWNESQEGTLLNILAALQNGQNFVQNLVEDQGGTGCPTNCPVYLEIKIWNGTTFDPPVYYDAAGNVVTPVGPLAYINPDFHLAQMVVLLTSINDSIDVDLSTRNAEATQLLIKNLLTTIDGDTSNLDVALSTLNKEATQLLIKNLLTTIDGDTSNLDVALSTRLADTTFTNRINTLGQKTSAQSTPVVLPSDQIVNVNIGANAMSTDAFGRLRVSNPFTLFDSSHRFADNGLWSSALTTSGTATFNSAQGLVDLAVTSASGSEVVRETIKVFSYQPGKSLLVLSTFVMNVAKTNLRQRVGYYGAANGYYLELNNSTVSFVERTSVSGALVNTPVAQASWNVDPMNGSGPSGITLDLTKAQILFMDLEWLGVGTVRIGFVINGNFYVCHKFHHANLITTTYITTASLPLRYEITNTGATSGASTLKQICSSVLSEGGYELRGSQQAIGTPITTPKTLATAGTFYPIVSIRLKSTRLDGIAVATALSAIGNTAANFNWQVIAAGTTTGGTWVSAGANSSVEYNITGTSFTGGRIIASGYFTATASTSVSVDILRAALLSTQLERDGLTNTPYEFTLVLAAGTNNETVFGSMDWEEISR